MWVKLDIRDSANSYLWIWIITLNIVMIQFSLQARFFLTPMFQTIGEASHYIREN